MKEQKVIPHSVVFVKGIINLYVCTHSIVRGRIQGGGDINTALGLLPDKLKTELALHVNLSVLKKVNYLFLFVDFSCGKWLGAILGSIELTLLIPT